MFVFKKPNNSIPFNTLKYDYPRSHNYRKCHHNYIKHHICPRRYVYFL